MLLAEGVGTHNAPTSYSGSTDVVQQLAASTPAARLRGCVTAVPAQEKREFFQFLVAQATEHAVEIAPVAMPSLVEKVRRAMRALDANAGVCTADGLHSTIAEAVKSTAFVLQTDLRTHGTGYDRALALVIRLMRTSDKSRASTVVLALQAARSEQLLCPSVATTVQRAVAAQIGYDLETMACDALDPVHNTPPVHESAPHLARAVVRALLVHAVRVTISLVATGLARDARRGHAAAAA
jgi:hypothetical protein